MKGATSAGSFTNRHILSITLAAFLFRTDERPRRAFPRSGAIKANVGESTAIQDIRRRDEERWRYKMFDCTEGGKRGC